MQTLFKYIFLVPLFVSQVALADPFQGDMTSSNGAANPITEVTPYVNGDKKAVIVFFKFNCPACRSLHQSLASWGKTLPKGIDYQMMPVLEPGDHQQISDETALGLYTFWVVDKVGTRAQQEAFASDAYAMVQDEGQGANRDRWLNLALSEGISRSKVAEAWKSEVPLMGARFARQQHYKPTATPTMVICGKWMISPDSANGDMDLFATLANGLVSRCMEGLGIIFNKPRL